MFQRYLWNRSEGRRGEAEMKTGLEGQKGIKERVYELRK